MADKQVDNLPTPTQPAVSTDSPYGHTDEVLIDKINALEEKLRLVDLVRITGPTTLTKKSKDSGEYNTTTRHQDQLEITALRDEASSPCESTTSVTNTLNDSEAKEVGKFAGYYALRSVFYKEGDNQKKKKKLKQYTPVLVTKPIRLVELQQYPGFDEDETTEIPLQLDVFIFLEKAYVAEYPNRKLMQWFEEEFKKMYYSTASKHILHDTFWYIFLERWQPSIATQKKLFQRISGNYVNMIKLLTNIKTTNAYMQMYPNLLSQALYSVYCHCYPDSIFQQFTFKFREEINEMVMLWITGIKPLPCLTNKWNLKVLQPPQGDDAVKVVQELEKPEDLKLISGGSDKELIRNAATQGDVSVHSRNIKIHPKHVKQMKIHNQENVLTHSEYQKSSEPTVNKDGNIIKNISMKKSMKDKLTHKKKIQNTITFGNLGYTDFTRSNLNSYGCSPLVQQYLYSHQLPVEQCAQYMKRMEIAVNINLEKPHDEMVELKEIVKESLKLSDARKAKMNAITSQSLKNVHIRSKTLAHEILKIDDTVEKILSNPSTVSNTANMLIISNEKDNVIPDRII